MKTALVTGALGSLGAALVSALKQKGYMVIGTDRKSGSCTCDAFINLDVLDLSHESAQTTLQNWMAQLLGDRGLDVLINNAASFYRSPAGSIDLESWRNLFETNVIAPFLLMRGLLPYLSRKKGTIINIGSVYPEWDLQGLSPYASSKAALLGMTQSLSTEWRELVSLYSLRTPANFQVPQVETEINKEEEPEKNISAELLADAACKLILEKSEAPSGTAFEVTLVGQLREVAPTDH